MIQALESTYTGIAFTVTFMSGLLTVMVERFLYARRDYEREATVTAVIGWSYIVGGTLFYVTLWILKQFM